MTIVALILVHLVWQDCSSVLSLPPVDLHQESIHGDKIFSINLICRHVDVKCFKMDLYSIRES